MATNFVMLSDSEASSIAKQGQVATNNKFPYRVQSTKFNKTTSGSVLEPIGLDGEWSLATLSRAFDFVNVRKIPRYRSE